MNSSYESSNIGVHGCVCHQELTTAVVLVPTDGVVVLGGRRQVNVPIPIQVDAINRACISSPVEHRVSREGTLLCT